ncbi:hypothetical protein [Paraflavitalea speifideaquila]|uniref:hypothetical protein n=1 Tax=Paraflavitalea speifideaquila TaxID=3076558 RepID=UPI0028E25742|nr:hypothetical protein [Paraflavitalea speifideiaquila]
MGDNNKNSVDVATNQYHFDGRIMSISSKHGNSGNSFNGLIILTKNVYDKIGRLQTLLKKFGTADFKKIVDYKYDELGHVKSKKIGKRTGSIDDPLETIDYSYNANGALTGLNKDYALSGSNTDQRNRYFGLFLGYENFDNKFTNARFDHLITGLIWKTQGDNTPRMYDFVYDNAGRLTNANFKQKNKPSETTWANAKVDFSESNILYDDNGNIKQLYRKGIQPANNSALYIDKLIYAYKQVSGGEWSNHLTRVFDNSPDLGAANNGKLGDFKDEVYNVDNDDYLYDPNGNLVVDNNKKIRNAGGNGITYNYLNKPEKIVLENKSTVEYVYDASGIKLAKKSYTGNRYG